MIDFYKDLQEHNKKRNILNHNQLKQEIKDILELVLKNTTEQENKIWPPQSDTRDHNGFAQKTIEKIIRVDNLKIELINFNSFSVSSANPTQTANYFYTHKANQYYLKNKIKLEEEQI